MSDVPADLEEQALHRVLAAESPAPEWFAASFLQRYPYRIVKQTVRSFLDRHGSLVSVERDGERWCAVYERGREPVVARVTSSGLVAGLAIGAAAVAATEVEVPYREWPRSVVARRLAVAAFAPLVLPPSLALAAWTTSGTRNWLALAGLGVYFCASAWLAAPWHVISHRLRLPVARGSAVALAASATRLPGLPAGSVDWLPVGTLAVVALVTFWRARGWRRPSAGPPLSLAFPLGPGAYDVAQGGPAPLNQHTASEAQRAALDIVALSRLGTRCSPPAIYPGELKRYAIFDRPVLAPCDGVVVEACDEAPDLEPPLRTPDRPPGNYVAIEADGSTVVLAHLRLGTVRPRVGDRVTTGQELGRVGNSGSTSEPHLHLHAERDGSAVPLVFPLHRSRPLRRNDLVRVRPVEAPLPAPSHPGLSEREPLTVPGLATEAPRGSRTRTQ